MEIHEIGSRENSSFDSGIAVKLIGPGDQEIYIPVAAESTTITVKVQYDTNHGTTNKPQVVLVANDAIGVSTQTITATVGTGTTETLSFSAFTPTAAGVVTVRLVSRSAAGNGVATFDTTSSP